MGSYKVTKYNTHPTTGTEWPEVLLDIIYGAGVEKVSESDLFKIKFPLNECLTNIISPYDRWLLYSVYAENVSVKELSQRLKMIYASTSIAVNLAIVNLHSALEYGFTFSNSVSNVYKIPFPRNFNIYFELGEDPFFNMSTAKYDSIVNSKLFTVDEIKFMDYIFKLNGNRAEYAREYGRTYKYMETRYENLKKRIREFLADSSVYTRPLKYSAGKYMLDNIGDKKGVLLNSIGLRPLTVCYLVGLEFYTVDDILYIDGGLAKIKELFNHASRELEDLIKCLSEKGYTKFINGDPINYTVFKKCKKLVADQHKVAETTYSYLNILLHK